MINPKGMIGYHIITTTCGCAFLWLPQGVEKFTMEFLETLVGGEIEIQDAKYDDGPDPKMAMVYNANGRELGLPPNEYATGLTANLAPDALVYGVAIKCHQALLD